MENADKYVYDNDAAIQGETKLETEVNALVPTVDSIIKMLSEIKLKSLFSFNQLQKRFQEQKILQLIAHLIELIYYKTMPEELREKTFKP